MAEQKKLSVQEILALARKQKAGGESAPDAPTVADSPPAANPSADVAPRAAAEAAAKAPEERDPAAAAETVSSAEAHAARSEPAKSAKPAGGKLSVAEMIAAARAGGAAKPAGAASPKPEPKPAAAKQESAAKAKPAAEKKDAGPVVGGPKDTASILAAARKAAKPGPITKAEAALKEKSEPATEKPARQAPPMPARPESLKPKGAKAPAEDRRGFLSVMFGSMLAVGYFALALAGGLWTLGLARFMFPNILTEPPSKFKVGFPSDFAPGKVEEKFKAQFGVWIVNTEYNGQPQIAAIRTVCTHLGCTPNWLEAEQKFKCPCHGSGFYKDGINFEGPAPRPLERYAIALADDGQLEVDKGKLFFEEMGQWSDPSSFYPA